ncbi:MAG: nucleotide sugar dehydrogenase [Bryobacteraceae bacterium]|nr:nucleotide sugar dehydrogenase [Bryobacteraceae bacterium]
MASETQIVVLGLGYVGCVTAACLAERGAHVVGVDRDRHKVDSVLGGRSPFYEPGLDELVRKNVAAGRLTAAGDIAGSLDEADIVMICVGTPSRRNGDLSLEQLQRASAEIAGHLGQRRKPLVAAVRSTVFPGTCEDLVVPAFQASPMVSVVSNPEFLREGTAVRDFFDPSLVVVGGEDRVAVGRVAALYAGLGAEVCMVSLRTAETIKYACNSFHALKVGFANEIGAVCSSVGVSGAEVMDILCRDKRLNISPAYLKPGFAFGGSCLPKDLRALVYRATRLDLNLPILESVLPSNEEHLRRAIEAAMELPAARIGILGLAFKENTDDLRESPVVALIERLIGKGRELRVFDPRIRLDRIYGSNRQFVLAALPHIERLLVNDIDALADWADHVIIAQKPAPEDLRRIAARGLPALDLVGAMDDAARPALLARTTEPS